MREILLGISGFAGSGKDTVGKTLENNYSFLHVSSSDLVRQHIIAEGDTVRRFRQTEVANRMRQVFSGHWIETAIHTDHPTRTAISGLYAPCEAEYLRRAGGKLVFVGPKTHSEAVKNFERIRNRADGPRDELDESGFLASLRRESSGTEDWQANLEAVADRADYFIANQAGFEELIDEIDQMISALEGAER